MKIKTEKIMLLLILALFSFIQESANAKEVAKSPIIEQKNLDPDSSLLNLKEGNKRFLSGHIKVEGQSKKDIERLNLGQEPNAIVVSCSDSRVPPETVFDQKLGEIFTVRTAGEALSPQAIGSMEFAIENLGSRLLVVLGHTKCGAVKAALDTLSGATAGSENLEQLVSDIRPRLKAMPKSSKPSLDLKEESWANARGVAQDLLKRSKIIADRVAKNKVKVVVGLYDLSTGKVEFEK